MRPMFALLPLLALLGCQRAGDGGKVLANVAGEKITEAGFKQMAEATGAPAEQVKQFLTEPQFQGERQNFLKSIAQAKALLAYGKIEGLDKDPKVRQAVEQATAKAYFQALVERRAGKAEPTEAQLREVYDKALAERTAMGQAQGFPKFEDVKAQLPQIWKQQRMAALDSEIKQELKEKVPVTFADDWKGSQD